MNQVTFDEVSSYSEWGMICTSFNIEEPEPKESYVDIPFGDGALDLTEALTGEVSYKNRSFEATFAFGGPQSEWEPLKRKIRAHLHGKRRTIEVTELPEHYLIGRCRTSFERDGMILRLSVSAVCEPYLYQKIKTVYHIVIDETGTQTITLTNSRQRVVPVFTTSDALNIEFQDTSLSVGVGEHQLTNLILSEGDNVVTLVAGEGTTIKIEYREGAL